MVRPAAVDGLALSLDDGVLDVVLDRGDGNLLTVGLCHALRDMLLAPPTDAHVLRLRAHGEAFCLGRERNAETPAELRHEVDALIDLNRALGTSALVSVAQVHGDAAGFGVGLAALCDVAVAARSARFSFPEVTIDLAPTVVLSWLPRLVGRRRAFLLAATGTPIDANTAATLGLITAVAPSDAELAATVDVYVAALRSRTPRVHSEIRAFLAATADATEAQAYDLAAEKLVLGSLARRRD